MRGLPRFVSICFGEDDGEVCFGGAMFAVDPTNTSQVKDWVFSHLPQSGEHAIELVARLSPLRVGLLLMGVVAGAPFSLAPAL